MLEFALPAIGAGFLAVVGWAVTINSRVAVLETMIEIRLTGIEQVMQLRFGEVVKRLDNMDNSLDKGILGYHSAPRKE